jgi:hypothetical protein
MPIYLDSVILSGKELEPTGSIAVDGSLKKQGVEPVVREAAVDRSGGLGCCAVDAVLDLHIRAINQSRLVRSCESMRGATSRMRGRGG